MDIIAPMIRTMPIMLKTESAVSDVLFIADAVLASLSGMLLIVTKNANTPTARMIRETTTPIMAPGSMKPNLVFTF